MTALLHHLLDRAAARWPQKEAIVDGQRRFTFREFADAAGAVASLLRHRQLVVGDRVAVYLDKSFEETAAIFATSIAGGIIIPVNALLRPRQVAHILHDGRARFLITSAERYADLRHEIDGAPSLQSILLIDQSDARQDERLVPAAFSTKVSSPTVPEARVGRDLAAILYTSGSTGMPKGAMLSHANLLAGSRIVSNYLRIRQQERILSVLPFSFDYGLNQLLTCVDQGATAILLRFRFGDDVVRALLAEQATGLAGVPSLWTVLAEAAPTFQKNRIPSLRYLTNSGGAVPLETLGRIRSAQPEIDFILMYGFTEAFRSTYLPAEQLDERPTSIGKAVPETRIYVVDDDDRPCPAGVEGILVHDGPTSFLGYWGQPTETRKVLRPNPIEPGEAAPLVCYSGDRVTTDEDGYLYFVGRDDAMIKSSGYRISPTEVESVLLEHESVREAAVIGLPDLRLGQSIKAFVRRRDGATTTEEELSAYCADRLPRYMVPKAIETVDEIPKTPNGKIDYPTLHRSIEASE